MALLPVLLTNLILFAHPTIATSSLFSHSQTAEKLKETGKTAKTEAKETAHSIKQEAKKQAHAARDRIDSTTSDLRQRAQTQLQAAKALNLNTIHNPRQLRKALADLGVKVTRAEARAIIQHRNTLKEKRFKQVEQLREIKALSQQTLNKMLDLAKNIAIFT